jgi:Zn-dependent M28 family amino/carboxypeptidase
MRQAVLLFVPLLIWTMLQPVRAIGGRPLALQEIQGPQIAAHLKFLAHDLLEGRAPATRGGDLAAEYLATQFATLGLRPAGERDGYFQPVPVVQTTVDPSFTLMAGAGAARRTYRYPAEVLAFTDIEVPEVPFSGEVVFVGHGIVAPEYGWNDYTGVDVRGRIVLVMVNDPPAPPGQPSWFAGRALSYYGRWTYKYEEAARQGAAGAILIHTTESATYPWQVVESSWSGPQYSLPLRPGAAVLRLKAWLTEEAATSLARMSGQDLNALRQAARVRGARPVPLGVRVSGRVLQHVSRRSSPNVVGYLPGVNEREAVVYTAHYDHLGVRDHASGDRVYNGALDNASGVAGMLEIAEAFARATDRPGRSVYFVATTAEEAGLLGSEHFAAHSPVPLSRIAGNLNIDGLNLWGRTRDLVLLGSERSTLGRLAEQLAAERGRRIGADPEPERGYFFRSDHFPLARVGVPALSMADASDYLGKGPDFARRLRAEFVEHAYHQPGDEFDPAWDFSGAVDDLRFMAELGWMIAAEPRMPAYHPSDQFARPRQPR